MRTKCAATSCSNQEIILNRQRFVLKRKTAAGCTRKPFGSRRDVQNPLSSHILKERPRLGAQHSDLGASVKTAAVEPVKGKDHDWNHAWRRWPRTLVSYQTDGRSDHQEAHRDG